MNPYSFAISKALHNIPLTMETIVEAVACHLEIKPEYIKGKGRASERIRARKMAIWLILSLMPEKSLKAIGKYFEQDHTSIMNAREGAKRLMNEDNAFRIETKRIAAKLGKPDAELLSVRMSKRVFCNVLIDGVGYTLPPLVVKAIEQEKDLGRIQEWITQVKSEHEPSFIAAWHLSAQQTDI